jgi:poly(3-hydroxybutyrate) depolymerase
MNRYSYQLYEMAHLALGPARALSDATRLVLKNPWNPWTHTHLGKNIAATAELFERVTRRYGKPSFGFSKVAENNDEVKVEEKVVWEKAFCRLVRFELEETRSEREKLLIVAPMSGHYATLLRGTVEAFLPYYDVYITDWADARMVPLSAGLFSLDDYIDYLIDICRYLKTSRESKLHTLGVCQPSVPLVCAIALLEAEKSESSPDSMVLMGGPIDTRRSPTSVNQVAQERGIKWFRRNCIVNVPFPYPGVGREVYPGFLQLSGFMAMNLDRHVNAHLEMFNHLVQGDGDSAEKHRDFYDEYLAVMDLDASYFLQTVEEVFVRHSLPKGELRHKGMLIELNAIQRTALMTVEGEKDDISGVGQTAAAHDLCKNIPAAKKRHYLQLGVGHYGVFNGSRFRREIAPKIREFFSAS